MSKMSAMNEYEEELFEFLLENGSEDFEINDEEYNIYISMDAVE